MRNIDLFMEHFSWSKGGEAAINALAGYLDHFGGPCPIDHDSCPEDCKLCWKRYLEREVTTLNILQEGDYTNGNA